MNTPASASAKKLLLAGALALAAISSAHAQLLAIGLPGQRALGERYVELSGAIVDPRASGFDRNGAAFGLAANFPASTAIDVGVHYGYGTIRATGAGRLVDWNLGTSVVVHGTAKGVKPFAGAALGYDRTEEKFGGFRQSDDEGTWGVGVGCEIPVGVAAFTPSLSHTDGVKRGSVGATHYGAQMSAWFGGGVGGFAEIIYSDFNSARGEAWTYRAGLRWKF